MDTRIGRGIAGKKRQFTALLVATAVVSLHVWFSIELSRLSLELPLVLSGAGVVYYLSRYDRPTLGLVANPTPSVGYWLRTTLVISLTAALLFISVGMGLYLGGILTPEYLSRNLVHVSDIPRRFVYMCWWAPLTEEICYRQVLCTPVTAVANPWAAVVLSGMIFAALHWAYGIPSLENQLGGFVLAWAYLKSGTIWIPIFLHSLGNLGALFLQIATWHWFVESGGL